MAKAAFRHVRVSGITAVVPEKVVCIDDEIGFFNNDQKLLERNKKILGLGTRHVADERTAVSDLLAAAANDLIERLGVDRQTIDGVIVVTTSPDYHYPATACILQGRLGLSEECSAFDVGGLACSAYVHGMWLAHSLVSGGAAKRVLVLAGDLTSTHSDRRNRNSNMLFGDAGSATLVEWTDEDRPSYFVTGTRGRDWDKLIAPAGGYALPIRADIADLEVTDETGNVWRMYDDIMKGMGVFKFTTEVGPKGISDVLELSGLSKDDVDYFAIHQANKQIVRTVAGFSGLPRGKWSAEAFSAYGNCGACAVVMDLTLNLSGTGTAAKNVCLATFGVGLSVGCAVLDMHDTKIYRARTYVEKADAMTREQKIRYWIDFFKGGNAVEGGANA